MIKDTRIYKNEMFVTICFALHSLIIAFSLYVYMGLPHRTTISDYEFINSQIQVNIEYKYGLVNIGGWFIVKDQESNRQLKRELVLSNEQSARTYAYPVQFIERPDVVKAFPTAFKNDKWKPRPGYLTQINTRFIEQGTYKLYLRYTYNDKKFIFDLKREVAIK